MKPDRILLAELRAEEAFDYLRNVNSGHPGSITSVHAASAELAFEQLVLLVKQSRGGQELPRADIKKLLYLLVDVVIQFGVERHQRFIKEIWYDPHANAVAWAPRAKARWPATAVKAIAIGADRRCLLAISRGAHSCAWCRLDPRTAGPLTIARYAYYYGGNLAVRRRLWVSSAGASDSSR